MPGDTGRDAGGLSRFRLLGQRTGTAIPTVLSATSSGAHHPSVGQSAKLCLAQGPQQPCGEFRYYVAAATSFHVISSNLCSTEPENKMRDKYLSSRNKDFGRSLLNDIFACTFRISTKMSQHFLLSAKARTLSLTKVMRMTDQAAETTFRNVRWTDGKAVCSHCGCPTVY